MKYTIYDPQSGEIVCSGQCDFPPDPEGQNVLLEGQEGTPGAHYVSGGVIVAYTPEQAAAKAARPEYSAAWSNVTFSWQDTRELAQAKLDARAQVEAARQIAQEAGFLWDGSRFDADDKAILRISGAVQLAVLAVQQNQPYSISWTLFDNTVRTLSGADMINVGTALGQFVGGLFAQKQALQVQIDAATTLNQLKGIAWPTS